MKVRTLLAGLAACACFSISGVAQAELMITEVVDGTLPGGQPKFVEIKNAGTATLDLSSYSFGNFSNGSTSLGGGSASVLSGSLASGETYLISYEATPDTGMGEISTFEDVYGFAPDFFMGGGFTNGDDAYGLFQGAATGDGSDATLIDVYGVIGVDGSGEVWEYTDSYAYRLPTVMSPNSTFTPSQWFFAGANALEGADDDVERQNLLDFTTPGEHNMVPEPSSVVMLLMAACGLGAVGLRTRLG